jgi:hypothetical protein
MHKNFILNLKQVCYTAKITYDINSPTSQTKVIKTISSTVRRYFPLHRCRTKFVLSESSLSIIMSSTIRQPSLRVTNFFTSAHKDSAFESAFK